MKHEENSARDKAPLDDAAADGALRRSFQAIRKGRGACPEAELLARFLAGGLSGEESATVNAHLAACGICDLLVTRMKQFEEPAERSEAALEREWAAAERKLLEGLEARESAGFLRRGRRVFVALLRRPALAYALVLLLLYPAYLGLFSKRPAAGEGASTRRISAPPPPSAGLHAARILDLNQVRGPGGVGNTIRLGAGDKLFILSFFVPIRTGLRYSAAITDEGGKTVTAQSELTSSDAKGNFYLVCDAQPFSGGRYMVTVEEVSLQTGQAGRHFRFEFALSR